VNDPAWKEVRMPTRSDLLARTFVDVADTLVADFDIVEFLTVLTRRCVELFDLGAAALLLADADDHVRVAASSNDRVQLLELLELQYEDGPCLDCYHVGQPISCHDMASEDRWTEFVHEARSAGYASVYAVPMRLREQVIGSLNLLGSRVDNVDEAALVEAQALADVATIGILQHRIAEQAEITQAQLQNALDSRVAIEQAKGYLAHTQGIDMDAAFSRIRANARSTQRRLRDVAADVITGRLDL